MQDKLVSLPYPATVAALQDAILTWYAENARDLPWRHTRDPYRILVSEIMLQQTQVDRVIPKYLEFLQRFPTLQDLAAAPLSEVIKAWATLGYNMRAVRLHRIARQVTAQRDGEIPDSIEGLLGLQGIGPYTASAVACLAFGHQVPMVDTNVRRVLWRIFVGPLPSDRHMRAGAVNALAQAALPRGHGGRWSQALMDIGATICLSHAPQCLLCPAQPLCMAMGREAVGGAATSGGRQAAECRPPYGTAPFNGSTRHVRGLIITLLRRLPAGASISYPLLEQSLKRELPEVDPTLVLRLTCALECDGLLRVERGEPDAEGEERHTARWLLSLP